ncbi:MAG: hypothetical protein ACJ747_07380 [Gaiellaceae bacterium]
MDAIRIVPLRDDAIAVATPAANMTYRGGPLLANVDVVTLYVGAAWRDDPLDTLARDLDGFFDFIVASELVDQLAEYSVSAFQIAYGSHSSSVRLDGVELGATVADDELRTTLRDAMSAGTIPQPAANTLYVLFLPPGVAVDLQGARSCQVFCGYHDAIDGNVFYAVLPSPDCRGCSGDRPALEALTITASHELAEAITDPVPGTGWYDDAVGEIGDICAWRTKTVGDYVVQTEWSNAARSCI